MGPRVLGFWGFTVLGFWGFTVLGTCRDSDYGDVGFVIVPWLYVDPSKPEPETLLGLSVVGG